MKEGDVLLLNAESINDLGFGVFNHAGTKVFAYGVLPGEQAELEILRLEPQDVITQSDDNYDPGDL